MPITQSALSPAGHIAVVAALATLQAPMKREQRRRFAIVCWRWTLVLIGATAASWLVYGFIYDGVWVPIQLPTTGIAIAAAGAFAGDLMALCVSCDQYVRGERHVSLNSLAPSFWKAWGALTAVFIALLSYLMPPEVLARQALAPMVAAAAPAPDPVPAVPTVIETASTQPWFVVYSTQPPPPAALPRLSTIPVFFRNNAAPETARAKKQDMVPGVSFTPDELDVSIEGLQRIVAALSACGAVPGGPATHLEIAGYASSKEFADPVAGNALADSDLRNAQIANRRARAAYCFVGSQTPVQLANEADWKDYVEGPECALRKAPRFDAAAPPLQVTLHRWPEDGDGYAQMVASRKFVDRPPGVTQAAYNDPEELNRRVDIHVVSAGACSAPAPASPQTAASPLEMEPPEMPASSAPLASPAPAAAETPQLTGATAPTSTPSVAAIPSR